MYGCSTVGVYIEHGGAIAGNSIQEFSEIIGKIVAIHDNDTLTRFDRTLVTGCSIAVFDRLDIYRAVISAPGNGPTG